MDREEKIAVDDYTFEVLEHGVLRLSTTNGPQEILIDGKLYIRFMDAFYLDRSTDQLDEAQVLAVCRERAEDTTLISSGEGNMVVKQIFTYFCHQISPRTLLELGPGHLPLFPPQEPGKYVLADTDLHAVSSCADLGYESVHFDSSNRLPFDDNYFELAIAIFVLHFHLYENQISELTRCLKHDGVFFANVYLIDKEAREKLIESFRRVGMVVLIEKDPTECCKNHEYWFVARSMRFSQSAREAFLRYFTEN